MVALSSSHRPSNPADATVHDCDGGLVFPAFVDLHTHLDKGHIVPRRANPDGSFMGALTAVMADRAAHWTADDVERRMEFSLRCACAHGTAAIRTHLDSAPPQHAITWPVFERVRARWAGRIELQAVALLGPDQLLDRALVDDVAATAKAAGGHLGGAISVHDRAADAIAASRRRRRPSRARPRPPHRRKCRPGLPLAPPPRRRHQRHRLPRPRRRRPLLLACHP